MAEENEDAEPSMDNILSSIRKILSEDEQAEKTTEQSSSVTSEAVASGHPQINSIKKRKWLLRQGLLP